MVKIAIDLCMEGLITDQEALLLIEPNKLDELLHPVLTQKLSKNRTSLHKDARQIRGSYWTDCILCR
ncbi:MAG: hypothetical protein R2773_06310 [Flavobacteriaceae bacterium]